MNKKLDKQFRDFEKKVSDMDKKISELNKLFDLLVDAAENDGTIEELARRLKKSKLRDPGAMLSRMLRQIANLQIGV